MLGGLKEARQELKEACHEWKLANYKVVNGCTLLDLTEESDFTAWDCVMGKDPVHLTGDGFAKLANGVLRMAEGPDAVFSGGKRAHEGEEERPVPAIGGRKSWIYMSSTGRGGGRGGRGGGVSERGGAAGRGLHVGRFGGGASYQSGGFNNKRR
jgi:hypothetical protein